MELSKAKDQQIKSNPMDMFGAKGKRVNWARHFELLTRHRPQLPAPAPKTLPSFVATLPRPYFQNIIYMHQ